VPGLGSRAFDIFNPYDGYAPLPNPPPLAGEGRVGARPSSGTASNSAFGERAHPQGHVHRQHRAAPRHGWRPAGQGSGRDCAGGIHHSKQSRLDHVRQISELTACDIGDHRVAGITLVPASKVPVVIP
jgi:hypothetical protein